MAMQVEIDATMGTSLMFDERHILCVDKYSNGHCRHCNFTMSVCVVKTLIFVALFVVLFRNFSFVCSVIKNMFQNI